MNATSLGDRLIVDELPPESTSSLIQINLHNVPTAIGVVISVGDDVMLNVGDKIFYPKAHTIGVEIDGKAYVSIAEDKVYGSFEQ